jgi:plastocyanin
MTRRLFLLLLTVLALTVGVAACGGDDDDDTAAEPGTSADTTGGGGGGTTLMLMADPSGALTYDPDTLTAPAGEVTIEFMNESGMSHNVEVEGNGVEEVSETITEGSTSLTLTLEPGEYEFYCTVDGHKAAGMEGTLTVE